MRREVHMLGVEWCPGAEPAVRRAGPSSHLSPRWVTHTSQGPTVCTGGSRGAAALPHQRTLPRPCPVLKSRDPASSGFRALQG